MHWHSGLFQSIDVVSEIDLFVLFYKKKSLDAFLCIEMIGAKKIRDRYFPF